MSNISRRAVVAAAGGGVLAAAGAGVLLSRTRFAQLPPSPVFAVDGVAIRGTDPVAYVTRGDATPGDPAIASDWNGARWHFASDAHRAAFVAEPGRYAPRYGGFCAWAVAERGQLFSTQPENWAIVEGQLYLNFDDDIQRRWERDIPGFIARADVRWPDIIAQA